MNTLILAIVIHLVCDWLLQNHWMAQHKSSLKHPAAWVHGAIHMIGMMLVFPLEWALLIAFTHILIDTRIPLQWWRNAFRQTREGEYTIHVAMWSDQVAHIAVLTLVVLIS